MAVRWRNFEALERRILSSQTVENDLLGLGMRITGGAAPLTPVVTGLLRSNWYMGVRTTPAAQVLTIGNRMYYAAYVELGTRFMTPRAMLQKSLAANGFHWKGSYGDLNDKPATGVKARRRRRRRP